jgi:hypothetical protein
MIIKKYMNFDIFYILINKLNVSDIINLILTDKYLYNIYKSNEILVNKLLIIKIFLYFNFTLVTINNLKRNLLEDEVYNISKIVFKKYNYFKQHRFCYKVDFIIFMLENNIDSDFLLKLYISECNFRPSIKHKLFDEYNNLYNNVESGSIKRIEDIITISDMEYMLINSKINQLDIILKSFYIPIKTLSFVIQELLEKSNYISNNIKLCIDYLFYKHFFKTINTEDKIHINHVIDEIVSCKRTDLLKYFLQKKNKYCINNSNFEDVLDYQYIINKCIEYQDTTHLELMIEENRKKKTNKGELKQFIIIKPSIIIQLCKKGSFSYLKYIIDTLLGKYINSSVYIQSICEGLNNINLMDNKIKRTKLKEFKSLYDSMSYFTDKNKEILSKYI